MEKLFFENKVKDGLLNCGVYLSEITEKSPLGVAVSGGADSVSLLVSLSAILGKEKIKVITVNHGIREKSETDGDAEAVKKICSNLQIECKVVAFQEGFVIAEAEKRKKGVEEAARFFRYQAFDSFIHEKNLCFLCLAHNKNDQLETVLMRLMAGSGSEGLSGIPYVRNKYIRPLLNISRPEIEQYLIQQNISWRTDSTNLENEYLRNRIRNKLVPFLNLNFPGWDKGFAVSYEKILSDNSFIESQLLKIEKEIIKYSSEKDIVISAEELFSLDLSLQRRLIFRFVNSIGYGGRFPYRLVKEISGWHKRKNAAVSFEGVLIKKESELLKIMKADSENKHLSGSGFIYVMNQEESVFYYGDYYFNIKKEDDRFVLCDGNEKICFVTFPFVIRSVSAGDKVLCADGSLKKVLDVFSDWKIKKEKKEQIPVVQLMNENLEIAALCGNHEGNHLWVLSACAPYLEK